MMYFPPPDPRESTWACSISEGFCGFQGLGGSRPEKRVNLDAVYIPTLFTQDARHHQPAYTTSQFSARRGSQPQISRPTASGLDVAHHPPTASGNRTLHPPPARKVSWMRGSGFRVQALGFGV